MSKFSNGKRTHVVFVCFGVHGRILEHSLLRVALAQALPRSFRAAISIVMTACSFLALPSKDVCEVRRDQLNDFITPSEFRGIELECSN